MRVDGINKEIINSCWSQGMALFWYNFTPDMEQDELTTHAGCPVLIGQKWSKLSGPVAIAVLSFSAFGPFS